MASEVKNKDFYTRHTLGAHAHAHTHTSHTHILQGTGNAHCDKSNTFPCHVIHMALWQSRGKFYLTVATTDAQEYNFKY